jgi:hypothetical protein
MQDGCKDRLVQERYTQGMYRRYRRGSLGWFRRSVQLYNYVHEVFRVRQKQRCIQLFSYRGCVPRGRCKRGVLLGGYITEPRANYRKGVRIGGYKWYLAM